MDLLLLSGNSKRGKDWLKKVDAYLSPQFKKTYRHDYAHWNRGEPEIDLDLELQRLSIITKNLSSYMIFAKSAGTVLASKAVALDTLRPKSCLFVGLPLKMIHGQNLPFKKWLGSVNIPIIILQHTSDPFGSFQEVKQYVKAVNQDNIIVNELPGDSHDYSEFQVFSYFAQKLVQ